VTSFKPRPDQRWTITVRDFAKVKKDPAFCSIVALARAVNALHFVHTPLLGNENDNTPAGMRTRYNSLLFTSALLAEASLLVPGMHKHFKGDQHFQKLAAVLNGKQARELISKNLFPVRNKLVFHFDAEEVRKQLADLQLQDPILLTAMGRMKVQTYHELADLAAVRTLFGPVIPGPEDKFTPILRSLSEVAVDFLVAAEEFMVAALTKRGWVHKQIIEEGTETAHHAIRNRANDGE
jgi:hypothetical protein